MEKGKRLPYAIYCKEYIFRIQNTFSEYTFFKKTKEMKRKKSWC